jgi:type IV fimbrial biogenesis protein FimT
MLVVIAIVGILAVQAASSSYAFLSLLRLRAATGTFFNDLSFARSEAIKRNSRVVLCMSPDGLQCVSNGGWEQGWMVFQDQNHNALVDVEDFVLARAGALQPPLRLSGNKNVSKYVSYSPIGFTNLTSGAFQAGTFVLCDASGVLDEAREIVISSLGRPRIAKVSNLKCPKS